MTLAVSSLLPPIAGTITNGMRTREPAMDT
eukprot:Gb_16658 [translate_table: standard]